ncbi:hypothetical protein Rhe02_90030 [Rhizocola hellebori]|uniref:Uncharacterized protein n=1 Tax=Rhizocola hellebori TaxID=1392758 RepID=A0A8J3QHW2_9ACTN|nr:hypothetical protein [Rhizocola hellebori]GIH10936.1 hypothetical protein Rhe02_90030 [Rhizocola hellebori]
MDERRSHQHESDVLLRQLDGHLARLEARREHHELALATGVAARLRELITDTMRSSAVDRARVRAAVHYFVVRPIHLGLWVVNDIMRDLGRHDLLTPEPSLTSTSSA